MQICIHNPVICCVASNCYDSKIGKIATTKAQTLTAANIKGFTAVTMYSEEMVINIISMK